MIGRIRRKFVPKNEEVCPTSASTSSSTIFEVGIKHLLCVFFVHCECDCIFVGTPFVLLSFALLQEVPGAFFFYDFVFVLSFICLLIANMIIFCLKR